jgi:hypothetical protein
MRAEDWLFAIKLLDKYPNGLKLMKGFGYEKAPFTSKDSLRQRRRWLLGNYELIKRRDVKLKHKLPAIYNLVAWYSLLPSLASIALNVVHSTGGVFPGSGFMAGLYWFTAINAVSIGYQMNKNYLQQRIDRFREKVKFACNFVNGIFLDSLPPWYALLKPTESYDNIMKDI